MYVDAPGGALLEAGNTACGLALPKLPAARQNGALPSRTHVTSIYRPPQVVPSNLIDELHVSMYSVPLPSLPDSEHLNIHDSRNDLLISLSAWRILYNQVKLRPN